jgi:predicted GNAT family acetyltransferase
MLIHYEDPVRFLQHVGPFLEEREVENNLILGISFSLVTNPERMKYPPYFAVVEEKGNIRAAAMMTPPHRIVLSRAEKEPLTAIVADLAKRRMVIPGVNGPSETSQAFANLWLEQTGGTHISHRSLRLYQVSHVIPPAPIKGQMREASEKDKNTLLQWVRNFTTEVGEPQDSEDVIKTVQRGLADRRMYLWEDSRLRSMAARSAPTNHGVRINLVYTPPEYRARGYASACVAALSQAMLDSGRKFCCLFADLSNPISNSIYQRIGYSPVCDFTEHNFSP